MDLSIGLQMMSLMKSIFFKNITKFLHLKIIQSLRYDVPLSIFNTEKYMAKSASLPKSTRDFNISEGFWLILAEG